MISLVNAHAHHIPLRAASVHCVVTSPPYWSLRDYGIPGQLGLEPLHDCMGWTRGAVDDLPLFGGGEESGIHGYSLAVRSADASDRLRPRVISTPVEGFCRERGHGHPRALDAHYAPAQFHGAAMARTRRDRIMGLLTKPIKTLDDLFVHTLQDIYYAEQQITKALPKMISKVTKPVSNA